MDCSRLHKENASILFIWLMDTNDFRRIDAHVACLSDGSRFWTCQVSGVEKTAQIRKAMGWVGAWPDWIESPRDTLMLLSRYVRRHTDLGPIPFYASTI